MENKKAAKILLILLGVLFWPIALPVWILVKAPQWSRSNLGTIGEAFVARKLHELDAEHYTVLGDILLPSDGNTRTTQIDHVVVSNYGIFCIETKSYKGNIYGSSKSKYWKQYIYSHQYELYNPLWQNYGHVKALEKVLSLRLKAPIESLIVFPRADRLKVHGTDRVGKVYQIMNNIRSYQQRIYTDEERDSIAWLIKNANITDREIISEHNADVRELAHL